VTDAPSGTESSTSEPQELTPGEIRDAFRRYDLIVAIGVLLMAAFASAFLASSSDLWSRLATGRLFAERFPTLPSVSDFSYVSDPALHAVNPSWLFDALTYQLYRVGEWAVVGAKVLVVSATVFLAMSLRVPGPTLGWRALVAGTALVTMTDQMDVGPIVVGQLLLVILLWVWHGARASGNWHAWIGLAVATSVVWANVDETFFVGPAVVLCVLLGDGLFGSSRPRERLKAPIAALAIGLVATLIAGCVSPFGWGNPLYVIRSIPVRAQWADLDAAGGGWNSLAEAVTSGAWTPAMAAWFVLLAGAIASCVLNAARWDITRVLMVLLAVALVAVQRWLGLSGLLLAVVSSLNAQEWYLGRFGDQVRTGFWPLLWGQATRVVLILLVFAGVLASYFGRLTGHVAQIGLGFANQEFAAATADWLTSSKLAGRTFAIGPGRRIESYLTWADPGRKAFLDSRWPDAATQADFEKTRFALAAVDSSKVDPNAWKDVFAKHRITHVVVDARTETDAMRAIRLGLSGRSDLAPLHVDDQCIVYGWLSDDHEDYARIRELRLQTNALAFRTKREPPLPTERTVTAPSFVDNIWPLRYVIRPEGMIEGTFYSSGGRWLSQPGASILAVSKLRSAVSNLPDSPPANLRLGLAYLNICQMEMAAIRDWVAKHPDVVTAVEGSLPIERRAPSDVILTRHHQMMAALQSAKTAGADNLGLYTALALAGRMNNFLDLWLASLKDQLRLATDAAQRASIMGDIGSLEKEVDLQRQKLREQIDQRSKELRQQADALEKELAQASESLKSASETDRPAASQQLEGMRRQVEAVRLAADSERHLEAAQFAFALALPLLAAEELDQIPLQSQESAAGAEFATRLLLRLGKSDLAMDRLKSLQRSRGLQPGVYQWLLAQVHITQGQLKEARDSLDKAIAEIRFRRAQASLGNLELRVRQGVLVGPQGVLAQGEAFQMTSWTAYEASYLYDLAMVHLELAEPENAAKDFEEALAILPEFQLRPLIDFYYAQIKGSPVSAPIASQVDDDIAVKYPDEPEAPTPKKE
jgi:tetratricopeptide (TPR) repeat protein